MFDFTIGTGSSVIIGFYLGGTGFGLKKRWYWHGEGQWY